MTSAPWTKVPLRPSAGKSGSHLTALGKFGSLSMVPVEIGPTELIAPAKVWPVAGQLP